MQLSYILDSDTAAIHDKARNTFPLIKPLSIFSDLQLNHFVKHIRESLEVLLEWIKDKPKDLKKIIYLAEEIVEIAQRIPSFLDENQLINMSSELDNNIIEIASQASKYQVGNKVDINKQISSLEQKYTY